MIVQESIEITTTPKKLFSYLIDINNRKDYIPALEEVVMLDPLPIQKGSRYIEIAEIAGRRLETTYQVIKFEENKLISAKTLKSIFPIQADLILEKKGNGSLLKINLDFQLKGIFKLASGIVKGIVALQARSILEKLQQNLEK